MGAADVSAPGVNLAVGRLYKRDHPFLEAPAVLLALLLIEARRHVERLAEAHRRRTVVRGLREAGARERAEAELAQARAFTEKILAYCGELADSNRGLIDKNEVSGFITLRLTEWIKAEATALGVNEVKK